jgi:hypothetical protein
MSSVALRRMIDDGPGSMETSTLEQGIAYPCNLAAARVLGLWQRSLEDADLMSRTPLVERV